MMSSIIISNYAGVSFVLFSVLAFAFGLGSAHGYDMRSKEERNRMSREWLDRLEMEERNWSSAEAQQFIRSRNNHPTNNGEHK